MILQTMLDIAEVLYITGEFLWNALSFSIGGLFEEVAGQFDVPSWVSNNFSWLFDTTLLDLIFGMSAIFLVIGIVKWVVGIIT